MNLMAEIFKSFKLIVGLGNPGAEYDGTRHNAGFMVIDELLKSFPAGRFEPSHVADSFLYTGRCKGRTLMLQKPQTYMNESGRAVGKVARTEAIAPEEVLVICDDLDLPLGTLRLRRNSGDGGHNGLKSIIAELGSTAFARVRIGIGRPDRATADYVLSRFEGEESILFCETVSRAAEAVKTALGAGFDHAMNRFNTKPQTAKTPLAAPKVQSYGNSTTTQIK